MSQANENKNGQSKNGFHFREDFLASIVVFLVALPLCIGIAVAVGVSPARALLTGIVGGIVVGVIAGSPLQVSGPAAGLFVIVADLIAKGRDSFPAKVVEGDAYSSIDAATYSLMVLGTSVFLAGIIQLAAGKLKLGQWFRAVSPAVIKGMLSGIGVLILVSQFHVMLDHKAMWDGHKAHGGVQYLATIPEAVMKCFASDDSLQVAVTKGDYVEWTDADNAMMGEVKELKKEGVVKVPKTEIELEGTEDEPAILIQIYKEDESGHKKGSDEFVVMPLSKVTRIDPNHAFAALTGIITIICIVLWPKVAPKSISFLPAALIAITVATIVANLNSLEVYKLKPPESLFAETTLPTTGLWFRLLLDPMVITGAIVIALVASAETLLCATAVDQMHSGVRTDYDKELTAQGIGNTICGLIGALPMTGVIVRSSANVASGAKSRWSAVMHGVWLLLFVALLPWVLRYIPKAALGALLVHIGYKLVNFKQIKELWNTSKSEAAIYLITVLVIVGEDLLVGVVVGIMLSAAKLLHRFSHLELELIDEGGKTRLEMQGAATFIKLPMLAQKLEEVKPSSELHVDFEHLSYIDHACLDLLMNWAKQHESTGGKLVLDWDLLNGRFAPAPKKSEGKG